MTDTDLTPLADRESVKRHAEIIDGLRLDLKIAVDGMPNLKEKSAEDICRILQGKCRKNDTLSRQAYSAASAIFAHEMFFRYIIPRGSCHSVPAGRAGEMIANSFGSVGNFFYLARTLASGSTAPGFLWLHRKRYRGREILGLIRLPLYTLPDLSECTPLLAADLWEHAYMDSWGRDISGYTDTFLRQVNWDLVLGITPK